MTETETPHSFDRLRTGSTLSLPPISKAEERRKKTRIKPKEEVKKQRINQMDCIFCKIAGKKIPSEFVHETEKFIAVKDIFPQSPTHLLIIPKAHYSSLMECGDGNLLGDMMLTAKDVAKKIGVGDRGFRLVINTNREGGQTVFHLHMHLMAGRTLSGDMG